MNRNNVRRTIQYLRGELDHNVGFNMRYFFLDNSRTSKFSGNPMELALIESLPEKPACGTTACIAGHIAYHFGREEENAHHIRNYAEKFLGLTRNEGEYLFMGLFSPKPLEEVTLEDAIDELERMLRDGPKGIESKHMVTA